MNVRQCPDQLFTEECRLYAVETWMLIPIGLVFAIQLGLILWGLIDTLRSDERGWFPALITLGIGGIVILVGTALAISSLAGMKQSLISSMYFVWGGAVACMTAGLFGWLLTLVFSLFAKTHYGTAMLRQIVATVSLVLLSPLSWMLWVEFEAPMPQLSYTAPDWFHEGKVKRFLTTSDEGWTVKAKTLDTLPPGEYTVPIIFENPPWTIQVEVDVTVSAAVASAQLPLRVGNQWVFSKRTEHGAKGGHTFYSRRGKAWSTNEKEAIRLSILGMHENEGKIWFSAEIIYSDQPKHTFMLMPKDGTTLYRPTPNDNWVVAAGASAPSATQLSVDRTSCSFEPMGLKNCSCSIRPGGPLSIPPGPLSCTISNTKNPVGSAVRGFFGIISMGLVDTGNPYKKETLGNSHWIQGPDASLGVPPAWAPTSDPLIDCMGGAYLREMRSSKVLSQLKKCEAKHRPHSAQSTALILDLIGYGDEQLAALKRMEPHLAEDVDRERLLRYVSASIQPSARVLLLGEDAPASTDD